MATCPKGHPSAATDYCDECGTPIGAAPIAGASGAAGTGPAAGTGRTGAGFAAGPGGSGEPCPQCAAARSGRFCEVCGYDFVAAELGAPAGAAPGGATPDSATPGGAASGAATPGGTTQGAPAGAASDGAATGGAVPDGAAAAGAGAGSPTNVAAEGGGAPTSGTSGGATPGTTPGTSGGGTGMNGTVTDVGNPRSPARGGAAGVGTPAAGWRVLAAADPEYHARMRAEAGPDGEQIDLPAFCPERRFELGRPNMLIGRRSRARGIEPDVDLTGPPTDPGISHAHAMLIAQADGGWAVVDLDSANGTYLNDSTDPIAANAPVPVAAGDRIHVGAWTTLTVRSDTA